MVTHFNWSNVICCDEVLQLLTGHMIMAESRNNMLAYYINFKTIFTIVLAYNGNYHNLLRHTGHFRCPVIEWAPKCMGSNVAGFRHSRRTIEHNMFSLRILYEKHPQQQRNTNHVFIDFKTLRRGNVHHQQEAH